MSSLKRNSLSEFPIDVKHVLHVWKILNGGMFSSKTFGLKDVKGRRRAVALFMDRSYERIKDLTANWTLEGPVDAPESKEPSAVNPEDLILSPVVASNAGRNPLITPDEFDEIRDVIHTMYKSKTYVTLKTLLDPVHKKLKRKISKSTLYRVLRRMGFRYQ